MGDIFNPSADPLPWNDAPEAVAESGVVGRVWARLSEHADVLSRVRVGLTGFALLGSAAMCAVLVLGAGTTTPTAALRAPSSLATGDTVPWPTATPSPTLSTPTRPPDTIAEPTSAQVAWIAGGPAASGSSLPGGAGPTGQSSGGSTSGGSTGGSSSGGSSGGQPSGGGSTGGGSTGGGTPGSGGTTGSGGSSGGGSNAPCPGQPAHSSSTYQGAAHVPANGASTGTCPHPGQGKQQGPGGHGHGNHDVIDTKGKA